MKLQLKLTDEMGNPIMVGVETDCQHLVINGVEVIRNGELEFNHNEQLVHEDENTPNLTNLLRLQ